MPLSITADSSELPSLEESLELAHRAQDGDLAALGDLLKRYEPRLRRIVRIRLGPKLRPHVDSMDIVQNAFVVALGRFGDIELRDRASVLKWLTRVVTHQVGDAVDRFTARKRTPGGPPVASAADIPADDTAPDEVAARAEFRALLDDEVGRLPDRDRELILLRDYHAGDWAFVASEVGTSIETAQRAYHRAWARLRERLAPRLRASHET